MAAPLDELFVRYWDGTLSAEQEADLTARLATDPAAAAQFRTLCLHAVVAAEAAAVGPAPARRRWRVATAGAVAAGLAAAVVLLVWADRPKPVRLVRASGLVRLGAAATAAGRVIPAGETVSTVGLAASAVLAYPDGTEVTLTGDTEARVGDRSRRLEVVRGAVLAEVPDDGFVIATPEASATVGHGSRLSLSRAAAQTEVGVTEGRVQLTDPDGDSLGDMGGGEVMTVDPDRATTRAASTPPPDEYNWDLADGLPAGWGQGRLALDPTAKPFGRVLLPELLFNRPNRRDCWILWSENRWVRGLFLVHPDSSFRVRYKVDRPGVGQLLAVVRRYTDVPDPKASNVLLAPIPFEPAADGGWRTVTFGADDWAVERKPGEPPRVPIGPRPWFVFLVGFNTYEHDLGLRVAEFSVRRGPAPAAAP